MSSQPQDKLRVFLSWSGERSEAVAQAFRGWLPSVLQNVQPYYTSDDIGKGARWASEIRSELENSEFGILFLTPENVSAPWILFEAGALSKLEKSRVAPLLIGLEKADVSGPLAQMQLTKFSKDECFKLIKSINEALGVRALEQHVLAGVFEMWWPALDANVQAVIKATPNKSDAHVRKDRDLLEEILVLIRGLTPNAFDQTEVLPGDNRILSTAEVRRLDPNDVMLGELGFVSGGIKKLRSVGFVTLADVLNATPQQLALIDPTVLNILRHVLTKYQLPFPHE